MHSIHLYSTTTMNLDFYGILEGVLEIRTYFYEFLLLEFIYVTVKYRLGF